jgi:TonB family protein
MKINERLEGGISGPDVVDLDKLYRTAPARRKSNPENRSIAVSTTRPFSSQVAAAAVVVVVTAHAAVIWMFIGIMVLPRHQTVLQDPYVTAVSLIEERHISDVVPLPEVRLLTPTVDSTSLTFISFDDPDAGLINGITAPTSAPQLDPVVTVDTARYAVRAGLTAGDAVTVVLAIEVLADGSAGAISIVNSTGDSAIDAAAIDCARALKWIPGTVDRRARVMRIHFALTLAVPT